MMFIECKTDKRLIESLHVINSYQLIHACGKGNIAKKMAEGKNLLGMVDQDPGKEYLYPYFKRMRQIGHQWHISIWKDLKANNIIIVLEPRLEEWLLQAARESHLHMLDYDLPIQGKELHKIINLVPEKLNKLLEDLFKKENPYLNHLKESVLTYFKKTEEKVS